MKAILVPRSGGPDVLQWVDLPVPDPGPGEIRVRLAAIGVNFADVLCRRATHRSMRPPPIVPGCEAAGVVDACGAGVTRWRLGDRVGVYSPFGGAYAEAMVVPERYALPLPPAMSFDEAAAFTHVALTAHAALCPDAPRGEIVAHATNGAPTLLVTAAAGGLGGLVLQLGAALGLRTIAAVGSPEKQALLRARGIVDVVDYGSASLLDAVRERTDGRGVDLVVETVGGAVFDDALRALAPLGRIVVAGAAGGALPSPDLAALLDRSATCTTLNLSVRYASAPDAIDASWATLTGLYGEGRLRPRIGRRLPLAQAAEAHRLLESRQTVDKLLLMP